MQKSVKERIENQNWVSAVFSSWIKKYVDKTKGELMAARHLKMLTTEEGEHYMGYEEKKGLFIW